jgi:hypothetical protein
MTVRRAIAETQLPLNGLVAAAICELVADYGLVVDEVREVNVNRFIAHLGKFREWTKRET